MTTMPHRARATTKTLVTRCCSTGYCVKVKNFVKQNVKVQNAKVQNAKVQNAKVQNVKVQHAKVQKVENVKRQTSKF
jgi:hypothetical protein